MPADSTNNTLVFPVLEEPTQDQLQSASLPLPPCLPSFNMASNADDSESLSSLNESAWDIVDERSAASGDEGHDFLRIRTPMSEIPEPIYMEEDLRGHDTSSESQYHQGRPAKFTHSRKDSSSDPPDTARPFAAAPTMQSVLLEDQASYIKYRESESQSEQEVSFVLTEFEGSEHKKLATEYSLGERDEIAGTVRQQMRRTGLSTSGPFKVIYVGPAEMKESIVNKIASALASNPTFSPRDSLSSSRVTVVPISSFANDSSPDVVLIDSMGIDMNIEVCKSAKKDGSSITLSMATDSKVRSTWNPATSQAHLPSSYDKPDLAVVYVPVRESSSAKLTRCNAREFFSRHKIPALLISYDTRWKSVASLADIDTRLPHLAIETFQTETGIARILRRQAVDINTFVNIDSAQLSRSLALLGDKEAELVTKDESSKYLTESAFVPTLENVKQRRRNSTSTFSIFRVGIIVFSVAAMLLWSRTAPVSRTQDVAPITTQPVMSVAPQVLTTTLTKSSSLVITSTVTQTLQPSPSSSESVAKIPVAELLKDNLYQNKSDKFQVQVVGDSHVILRAPSWFSRAKKQQSLKVSVQRAKQPVPHELSALFTGVYAVKLPQEYAYGTLEITVSASTRPRVQEVFQVELGNPWLKISGWQRAALAMKDHVAEDFFSARVGLLKAYSTTSNRVQYFFKDVMARADSLMKEAEKASSDSFSATLEHTDQLLAQTKSLTRSLTERIRSAGLSQTATGFMNHHESLTKDLSSYSKKISSLFITQAKSLTGAASGLVTLGQDIQAYRETHFVDEQKKLLQTWWSIFGVPSDLKEKLREREQEAKDEQTWGSRVSARRAARRRRQQERRRKRNADSDDEEDDTDVLQPVKDHYRRAIATVLAMRRHADAEADSDWDSDD